MLKIVFFGSPAFAVPSLQLLSQQQDIEIVAVVTQPDKPKGRYLKLQPTPIAQTAERLGLPIIKVEHITDSNVGANIVRPYVTNADLFVVVAYGALLPPPLLMLPKYGAINLHPSLLPRYRGASPIQAAILNGDHEIGVSVMMLDEELDHGPILWQETVPVEHHDTAESLSERLAGIGAQLLTTTIPLLINGELRPQPQDHVRATFTKQITKEDGKIDWAQSADHIARMIRAYHPWPGAWTTFACKGKDIILKIIQATIITVGAENFLPLQPPGTTHSLNGNFFVMCGNHTLLQLDTLQPAGKKPMRGQEFMNGYRGVNQLQ